MTVYTLGIDIREEYAALALVTKKMGGVHLVRSHGFRLLTKNESGDPGEYFAQEVNDFLGKGKIKPKSVIVSLPRQTLSVQSFDLPVPESDALDAMVLMEMDRHFPFPLESMNMSYHIQTLSAQRKHIIAAAGSKHSIGQYLDWLGRAGLKVDIIEPSLANQISLLNQTRGNNRELQAIVDIGSNWMDISLIKGKTLITTRSLPIRDPDFNKMYFFNDLPESLTESITNRVVALVTDALESTLYGCKSLESEDQVQSIHLFGGGYAQEYLSRPLEVHTNVIAKPVGPDFLKKDTPLSFNPAFHMTALGLAMSPFLHDPIELNLHPQAKIQANEISGWRSIAALALLIPAAFTGILLAQNYRNDQTLASLDHQLNSLKPLTAHLEKIDREFAALEEQTQTLNSIERQSPLKLPLLKELSHKLPKDTWVSRISIKENQVELRGYSASASKLIPTLEASDILKNARFKGSVTTQAQGKRFTIQSTLEPRE